MINCVSFVRNRHFSSPEQKLSTIEQVEDRHAEVTRYMSYVKHFVVVLSQNNAFVPLCLL